MKKIQLPKFNITYFNPELSIHLPCGTFVGITNNSPRPNNSINYLPINTPSDNSGNINLDEPLRKFTIDKETEGFLVRFKRTLNVDIPSGTSLFFNLTNQLTIEIKTTVSLARYTTLTFYGRLIIKRRRYTEYVITINDKENITIPVYTAPYQHWSYGSALLPVRGSDRLSKAPYNPGDESPNYTTVFTDMTLPPDRCFCTWDFKLKKDNYNAYGNRIIVDHNELTNEVHYVTRTSIVNAYTAAGGTMPTTGFMVFRFRGYNLAPVTGDPEQYQLPDDESKMLYDVGIINSLTEFDVSLDGYTISGKFNGKCIIDHRFRSELPITINSDSDGYFTYTSLTSYLGGGQLTLTPRNRAGTYKTHSFVLPDRTAPNPLTDLTVTKTGIYGVGEVGAIVKLYTEDMEFIAQTTIPGTGTITMVFDEPIPDDVTEKVFIYTIEDVDGNVRPGLVITYQKQEETVTGPINELLPDFISYYGGLNSPVTFRGVE